MLANYFPIKLQVGLLLLRHLSKPCPGTSPVNLLHGPNHMRSTASAQEQDKSSEVLRRADSPRRLSSHERVHRLPQSERGHARGEHTGTYDVDIDVFRGEFRGLDAREVDACGLRGAVGVGAVAGGAEAAGFGGCDVDGADCGHGGDVDDAAGVVG